MVAMAVDPFTQQVLQFYSCSTLIEGENATVPFSNNYTAGFLGRPSGVPDIDPQMLSAIYSGLLDPPVNASSAIKFECRTGNCTFPSTEDEATFLSLAMNTQCADISSNISLSVNVKDKVATLNASLLEYGIHLHNDTGQDWPMKSGFERPNGLPSSFLLKFAFLMAPDIAKVNQAQAFECEFFPVVNTYSVNVTNGVLLEQVLASERIDIWTEFYAQHALLPVNKTIRAGEWHQCFSTRDPSDENDFPIIGKPKESGDSIGMYHDSSPYGHLGNYTEWWPHDCVYSIGYEATASLRSNLEKFLGKQSLSYEPSSRRVQGDLWAVNLWRDGNATLETIQAAMDGISRSITARWRQDDSTENKLGPVLGAVWTNQTCVRVHWGWMAFPGGLLLLTIVFLVLTVLKTRSSHAPAWKSSIFAVLFSGLDQETRQAAGPVVTRKEMEAAADRATVRLEDTNQGYRLVSTS